MYYNGQLNPTYYPHEEDYSDTYYRRPRHRYHGSSGGMLPRLDETVEYADSEECRCQCNRCDHPEPCCQQMCVSCSQRLLFVPYPYPLVVNVPPTVTTKTDTTTTKTTATEKTNTETTTTKIITQPTTETAVTDVPTVLRNDASQYVKPRAPNTEGANTKDSNHRDKNLRGVDFNNIIFKSHTNSNGDHKYILTSLRRTKANWLPKYGIVPIPDQIAQSLMSQLRTMKGINTGKEKEVIEKGAEVPRINILDS